MVKCAISLSIPRTTNSTAEDTVFPFSPIEYKSPVSWSDRVELFPPSAHPTFSLRPFQCVLDKPQSPMENSTIVSAVVHLLGVSVVSHLISRRVLVNGVQCSLKRASWPRICVLIVFLDSYLFLFTAGILILGVGMTTTAAACSLGIYLCIVFYGTSKLFIYLFLSEFSPSSLERRLGY